MACIIGVIAYRLAVYAAFASIIKDPMSKIQLVGRFITPQLATSVTASCINFVLILILNFLYERVAVWITDLGQSTSNLAPHDPSREKTQHAPCLILSSVQRSPKPTFSTRTGWQWRCSCSSLSTTTPPASTLLSLRANLSVFLASTCTCLAKGAGWGTRRWVPANAMAPAHPSGSPMVESQEDKHFSYNKAATQF